MFGVEDQTQLGSVRSLLDAVPALFAGCAVLLTEDMGTGQVLAGVKLVNPFAPA